MTCMRITHWGEEGDVGEGTWRQGAQYFGLINLEKYNVKKSK